MSKVVKNIRESSWGGVKKSDISLYKWYLNLQEDAVEKYGKRTIVVMQVGHFMEIYGRDDDRRGCAKLVSELLSIKYTRKNSFKEESDGNPAMTGINIASADDYITILAQKGYTVVVVEEVEPAINGKKEALRKITDIKSPSTILDKIGSDSNYLVSIYLKKFRHFRSHKNYLSVGLACIDPSTGLNVVYEAYDKEDDESYALDETLRFILSYNPKEVIINIEGSEISNDSLVSRLELFDKLCHIYHNNIESKHKDVNWQNEFIRKIFESNDGLTPLESLGLKEGSHATLSYILLLNYAHDHNKSIVSMLAKPSIWNDSRYLVLDNNAITQLDIVSDNVSYLNEFIKYHSLFDIINNTSTAVGQRLLKVKLLNPIINVDSLEKRYNAIEEIQKIDMDRLETVLRKILDIERSHRRLSIGLLHPFQFYSLHLSYIQIPKLIDLIKGTTLDSLSEKTINAYIREYSLIFNLDSINRQKINEIYENIFRRGVLPEADKIEKDASDLYGYLNELAENMSKLIKGSFSYKVKVDHTEKSGYYLAITKGKFNLLKKALGDSFMKVQDEKVYLKDLNIKGDANIKITSEKIDKISSKLLILREKMRYVCQIHYSKVTQELFVKHRDLLKKMSSFVAELDVVKSHAKTAKMFNYVRPKLIKKDTSMIKCKDLRHPIVERINKDEPFTPNDVDLDSKGSLVFGVNGSGKTIYMKSVGLAIIMAQMGSFVPVKSMELSPFELILTRILGNDNMFKGQSSYKVEMIELRNILKRSNSNSIVLGDEICKGTEHDSGDALTAVTIERIANNKVNFVFATHQHALSKEPIITDLSNVDMSHMSIEFKDNDMIYNRRLKSGSGETSYGIEVASMILGDPELIKKAYKIRNRKVEQNDEILPTKTSKYNNAVFMDKCQVCSKTKDLDTHHIKFQCTANKDGFINHYHKNEKHNLVNLCKAHHNEVHNGSLDIKGWIKGEKGRVLDYEIVVKKMKKKYDDDQIKKIKNLKGRLSQRDSCIVLKDKHSITISTSTLSKIWRGKY
jgi:DNA mismatch repair protein MutS